MSDAIGSMKALEAVIGKTPPAIGLKVIDPAIILDDLRR